jgi:hypothetical protein
MSATSVELRETKVVIFGTAGAPAQDVPDQPKEESE